MCMLHVLLNTIVHGEHTDTVSVDNCFSVEGASQLFAFLLQFMGLGMNTDFLLASQVSSLLFVSEHWHSDKQMKSPWKIIQK